MKQLWALEMSNKIWVGIQVTILSKHSNFPEQSILLPDMSNDFLFPLLNMSKDLLSQPLMN